MTTADAMPRADRQIAADARLLSEQLSAMRARLFPPASQKQLRPFSSGEAARLIGVSDVDPHKAFQALKSGKYEASKKGEELKQEDLKRVGTRLTSGIRAQAIGPNDVWAMDFVHDQLATGRKLRILTIVDMHLATRQQLTHASLIRARMWLPRSNRCVARSVIPARSGSTMAANLSHGTWICGLM